MWIVSMSDRQTRILAYSHVPRLSYVERARMCIERLFELRYCD